MVFRSAADTGQGRIRGAEVEGEPKDDTIIGYAMLNSQEGQKKQNTILILTLPADESHSKQCDLLWGTSYSQHRPLGMRNMIDDSSRRGRADHRQC